MKTKPALVTLIQYASLMNFISAAVIGLMFMGAGVFGIFQSNDPHALKIPARETGEMKPELLQKAESFTVYAAAGERQLELVLPYVTYFVLPIIHIRGFTLSLPILAMVAALSWLLFQAFRQLDIRKPFTEANAQRVLIISWLLIAIDVVRFAQIAWLGHLVSKITADRYYYLPPALGDFFKTGLVLLVVGWIFKTGIAMQREQDFTV